VTQELLTTKGTKDTKYLFRRTLTAWATRTTGEKKGLFEKKNQIFVLFVPFVVRSSCD